MIIGLTKLFWVCLFFHFEVFFVVILNLRSFDEEKWLGVVLKRSDQGKSWILASENKTT